MYFYLKAIHIIFIVTWFAALFYMPRLFVYDIEARDKEPLQRDILLQQFRIMQRRLWFGISWPSMIITLILGPWLAVYMGYHPADGGWYWLNWKIGLVILLVVYHIACHKIMLRLAADDVPFGSQGMRIWNEVATIFLFAIVFLVVFKSTISMLYGLAGLIALIAILMAAIKIYKLFRT